MTTRIYNAFSLILLLQFLAIVGGTLLTSAMLKVNGYPELEIIMEWNPISVFIRNWGWIAIVIPVVLYFSLYRYADMRGDSLEDRQYVILAVLMTFLIILFYAYTVTEVAERKSIFVESTS